MNKGAVFTMENRALQNPSLVPRPFPIIQVLRMCGKKGRGGKERVWGQDYQNPLMLDGAIH